LQSFSVVCTACGDVQNVGAVYRCRRCGGILEIAFDYERIFAAVTFDEMAARKVPGIWKYRELLPADPEAEPVTLGEGGTPLLEAGNLKKLGKLPNVLLKNETVNPTLSFKDRPMSVALTAAGQLGMREVVCASTGNTGVAASAYAARAGLACTVYAPVATPREKLAVMESYGAALRMIEGTFSDAYAAAQSDALDRDAFNLTSTYLNPYMVEGDKTLAYEIAVQYGGVPDWVIVPIGAGPLLAGCFKGFREMKEAGFIDRLPRMAGVQAAGCAPIVRAFKAGKRDVDPWEDPIVTKASGIADPLSTYPGDGTRTLSIIRESGGVAIEVEEERLFHWRRQLAEAEGLLAELSSTTAVAAAEIMVERRIVSREETVVAVVTGHGLKDMTVTIPKT
jgi:threonine synthase